VTRSFSLAHLTVLRLTPPEMIRVAARTGYQTVGLRLIGATDAGPAYPLMRDATMLRETKVAIAETGVGILDLEFIRITPEIDVNSLERFMATGAELGARHVITAPYDPDLSRLADRLAAIAELAARYGLGAVLEFFPWTVVPSLGAAVDLVEAAKRADIGILVDTLHFNRSGSRLGQLEAIPASRLPFVHVADAPVQDSYSTEELLHGRPGRAPAAGRRRYRHQGHHRPHAPRHTAGAGSPHDGDGRRRRRRSGRAPRSPRGGSPVGRLITVKSRNALQPLRAGARDAHRLSGRIGRSAGDDGGGGLALVRITSLKNVNQYQSNASGTPMS